jgi:3-hydroxyisobutyrate dehydrogenase and related beta-hydroxyacid dehydrogenases
MERGARQSGFLVNPERMTTRPLSIGFAGLGVMGRPMASHLAAAGHAMTLYDIAPGLARDVASALPGTHVAATPAELAARSDIVVTMVPNGAVVQELVCGDDGLLRGLRPGSLVLDTSSSEPWLTEATGRLLAAAGAAMVDAPVSGAQWGAEAAELVFMCGGAEADIERVRPLLERMGKAVFHLGPLGAGHAMKCLNNLVTASNFLAVVEALAIGKRAGSTRGDGRRARPVDRHVVDLADAPCASASSAAASTIRSSSR